MKAFPIANMEGDEEFLGMDLQDYFAAKAMQGFCANITRDPNLNMEFFAKKSYIMANQMLRLRKIIEEDDYDR